MKKADALIAFERIGGREGIAKRCLELAAEILRVGSYKHATATAGQLRVLAEVADKADCYWGEIQGRGYRVEFDYLVNRCSKPYLQVDGHLDWAKTQQEDQGEKLEEGE